MSRKWFTNRPLALLSIVAIGMLVVSACSSSGEEFAPTPTTAPAQQPAPAATAAPGEAAAPAAPAATAMPAPTAMAAPADPGQYGLVVSLVVGTYHATAGWAVRAHDGDAP